MRKIIVIMLTIIICCASVDVSARPGGDGGYCSRGNDLCFLWEVCKKQGGTSCEPGTVALDGGSWGSICRVIECWNSSTFEVDGYMFCGCFHNFN